MSERILNRDLLPGNECFGCGHENPNGLHIEVTDEGEHSKSLVGRFEPPEHLSGFPGITHGGALFTAMDCLATWVVAVFGPRDERYWLLGSSEVGYRRPAAVGDSLRLSGRLVEGNGDALDDDTLDVHVRIESSDGQLVAEGEFHEIGVSPEKFAHLAGTSEIPRAWRNLFERPGEEPGGG